MIQLLRNLTVFAPEPLGVNHLLVAGGRIVWLGPDLPDLPAATAFIEAHPRDALAGNANYWLAETYYVRGDYRKAAGYFAAGYKNFPDSNKASDNLLKLAMSLANLEETDQACLTFKELSERYPEAPPAIKQRAVFESQRAGCG